MSWWQFWNRKPEPEHEPGPSVETRRKSITAMLDGVIAKVEADQDSCDQGARMTARKAANASRKVIMRTGQFSIHDMSEKESTAL